MARLPLQFHPDARIDALAAYDWYAERSRNAAESFRKELQDAGDAIQRSPELWAEYLFGTRRYLMKRFPFVVVYRIAADRIEIVAVAHGRRRPGYWQGRLESD
ncbi:MAG: type II toxin-antitoxin system RelE/ParE family toxin [Thermoguttaceae bacterium]|jgi:plasmid stabilization system protein ParE